MRYRFKYLKSLIIFWRNKLVLGLTRAKNKIQQYRSSHGEDPEIKAARDKGYREGALVAAEKQGKAKAERQYSSKGGNSGMFTGISSGLSGLGDSINHAEKMFGFSDSRPIGGGLDFGLGFGGGSERKAKPEMRETIVRKNGTIIIREPSEASKKAKMAPRKNFLEEIEDNNPF